MAQLVIKDGLKASGINSYSSEGHGKKTRFHADGKAFLKSLASALKLSPSSYNIRSNRAGIAISGEVTLHADHLYVELSESYSSPGVSILYRSCTSQKDYTGGPNHFAHASDLEDAAAEDEFLDTCRRLMVEGATTARHRAVA